jgi:hypothetical protein
MIYIYIYISLTTKCTLYKKRLSSVEEGTTKINVRRQQGKFVLHEDYSKPPDSNTVGIGVTPFRNMIKYATDKHF